LLDFFPYSPQRCFGIGEFTLSPKKPDRPDAYVEYTERADIDLTAF
jgi:hypothetical protein